MRRVSAHRDCGDADARDPLTRALASPFAPSSGAAETTTAPAARMISRELEQLLVRLAKRAQLGGDGRRATARVELDGAWNGAVLTVHALASREVSVDIEVPPGVRAEAWSDRIKARLEQRGFAVAEIAVH